MLRWIRILNFPCSLGYALPYSYNSAKDENTSARVKTDHCINKFTLCSAVGDNWTGNDIKLAWKLLDEWLEKDEFSNLLIFVEMMMPWRCLQKWKILIEADHKDGNSYLAQKRDQEMKDQGSDPCLVNYSQLIDVYWTEGRLQKVYDIYTCIKPAGFTTNHVACNTLIIFCSQGASELRGEEVLEEHGRVYILWHGKSILCYYKSFSFEFLLCSQNHMVGFLFKAERTESAIGLLKENRTKWAFSWFGDIYNLDGCFIRNNFAGSSTWYV